VSRQVYPALAPIFGTIGVFLTAAHLGQRAVRQPAES